jgi:hypothetical protein
VGLGTRNITKPDASVANNSARKDIKELPLNAQNVASLLILDPLKNGSPGTIGSRTIESSGRTTITLAHSITSITLHLRLDVAKPHREYRAVIETAAGRPVTTLSWSTFTFSNIVDTPSLRAVDLPAGDYKLFLAGKISNGSFVRVAEFSFRVIRNK